MIKKTNQRRLNPAHKLFPLDAYKNNLRRLSLHSWHSRIYKCVINYFYKYQNHGQEHKKLESREVPTYILRLLSNELIGQYICVRWGSTHSEFFPIGNGVKQGGILSPLLFNVYMDDLSLQLHRQPIGCSVGGTVVNHML